MRKRSQLTGFTLVELLVVIGIIALLISILLPALNRAKEQANRVLCMSNHKQILAGIFMYATDNKNVFPHTNWGNWGGSLRVPGWLYDDQVASGKTYLDESDVKLGAVYKYLKNTKVFRCPFDHPPYEHPTVAGPSKVHPITSYGLNGALINFGRAWGSKTHVFTRTTQYKPEAIIMWELDEYYTGYNIYNDASNFPREGISARHGSRGKRDTAGAGRTESKAGAIVSTAGQSVEWITVRDYFKEVDAPGRSRLWIVPSSIDADGGH